jgi:(p)ppGpp synthase/HD superfamily hydrolase
MSPRRPGPLLSRTLEQALRACARWHHGQTRKGDPSLPYITHAVGVALILDRLGFAEAVVIAGLLHDVAEDCQVPLTTLAEQFGPEVAGLVAACSERKHDGPGQQRPWLVRKTEYLQRLASAPVEARAVALADKLHNLGAIALDLRLGVDVWSLFNADRDRVLWYYQTAIDSLGHGDARLEELAAECRRLLAQVTSAAV